MKLCDLGTGDNISSLGPNSCFPRPHRFFPPSCVALSKPPKGRARPKPALEA